jgi:hypothetical protein
MAGRQGFEPRYADPESAVLPLDDLPIQLALYQFLAPVNHIAARPPGRSQPERRLAGAARGRWPNPQRLRYSCTSTILCSRQSRPLARRPRQCSTAPSDAATCAMEAERRADSRMQAPRKPPMYCNSSPERPSRKRRTFLFRRSPANAHRALTRTAFTLFPCVTTRNCRLLCRKESSRASESVSKKTRISPGGK